MKPGAFKPGSSLHRPHLVLPRLLLGLRNRGALIGQQLYMSTLYMLLLVNNCICLNTEMCIVSWYNTTKLCNMASTSTLRYRVVNPCIVTNKSWLRTPCLLFVRRVVQRERLVRLAHQVEAEVCSLEV